MGMERHDEEDMNSVRAPILLAISLALSGCASKPEHQASGLDTGDIAPNAERSLTFETTGRVEIHCHPHQWMFHNVTVTDAPASEIHVDIVDGIDEAEFRFEPANLTVGKGSRVSYHNHGNFTHTATQKANDAAATAH